MNRIVTYFIALIFLTSGTSNTLIAQKTGLILKLKKAEHFEYLISSSKVAKQAEENKDLIMEQNMELTIDQTVLDKLKNGNYLMQADYKKLVLKINTPDSRQEYNSDASNNQPELNELLNGISKLKIVFELSSSGEVSHITGFEEMINNKKLYAELINVIKEFATDQLITEMFNYLPKSNVELGEKWMTTGILTDLNNQKYDINYSLVELSPENIKLNRQSNIKYTSGAPVRMGVNEVTVEEARNQNGFVSLNPKNKMPKSSILNESIDMLIITTNTATLIKSVKPMKLTFITTLKLVK